MVIGQCLSLNDSIRVKLLMLQDRVHLLDNQMLDDKFDINSNNLSNITNYTLIISLKKFVIEMIRV